MPPSRLLEQALLVRDRAGEGAAHVAEQLGLEQPLGQRAAVDRHERAARARAVAVDGARDQLLAGAGLSGHEHRRVRRARERDLLVDREHAAAAPHQPRQRRPARGEGRLRGSPARAARRPSARSTTSRTWPMSTGLLTVVERARLDRLQRGLQAAERADQHHLDVGVARP